MFFSYLDSTKNFEEGRNVFIRIIIKKQKTKSCDHESVKNASHRHLHLNHRNETKRVCFLLQQKQIWSVSLLAFIALGKITINIKCCNFVNFVNIFVHLAK
jgi:hypothetical protein